MGLQITVNGETKCLDGSAMVADLLDDLGLEPRRVAVERNKLIVRRADYNQTALQNGDCLEIVTFVGGG